MRTELDRLIAAKSKGNAMVGTRGPWDRTDHVEFVIERFKRTYPDLCQVLRSEGELETAIDFAIDEAQLAGFFDGPEEGYFDLPSTLRFMHRAIVTEREPK